MKHILLLSFFIVFSVYCFAQWNTDTLVRNAICTVTKLQFEPQMCSDGAKGAIIVWSDLRDVNERIYAQRIDSNGITKWTANGVLLTLPVNIFSADFPLIVADDAGGAIVFYNTSITGGSKQIYAQHLDADGNLVWTPGGVAIATAQDSRIRGNDAENNQNAVTDDAGGAYITWQGYGPFNIYAQHIDKNGNIVWHAQGVTISNNINLTAGYNSYIISTGSGTAVVAYSYGTNLYLQRMSAKGSLLWGFDGVTVANSFYSTPSACYLGFDAVNSTMLITWNDSRIRAINGLDLYAQKIDLNGNILWQANGIVIETSAYDDSSPVLLVDNDGGFYVIYGNQNAKVQHGDTNGQLLWGTGGIQLVSGNHSEYNTVICSDGSGGIIAEWHEQRNGYEALYAQRYNTNGEVQWRQDGVPVIIGNPDLNNSVNPLISLYDGNAITCWSDYRNVTNNDDIYAARFGDADVVLPVTLLSFTAISAKRQTQLEWVTEQEINISYFQVERSADAVHFSTLLTVQRQANSSAQHTYKAIDASPNTGNYYRLKQVDYDGKFIYSLIVNVKMPDAVTYTVYPNPAKNTINVKLTSVAASKLTLLITDMNGRELFNKVTHAGNGESIVHLDVSRLAAGTYFLKIINTDGSENAMMKFVKQ